MVSLTLCRFFGPPLLTTGPQLNFFHVVIQLEGMVSAVSFPVGSKAKPQPQMHLAFQKTHHVTIFGYFYATVPRFG